MDEVEIPEDVRMYPVPLAKIAKDSGGEIMRNTVAIGASFALIDFDLEILNNIIKENFTRKGEHIVSGNIDASKAGYDYVKNNFPDDFVHQIQKKEVTGKMFISGHEALAMGAIKSGCKFYAAYPMTPASSLLHVMAANEKKYNIVVKHTEDEIGAINMGIGAGYAGVRAMVGTSGGGFSLMVEGFGLAAQTETPLVIVESQRPGPATGMATHSGQADLRFMLHASTDEYPRLIIAPGDVNECFYKTVEAFNMAEKYQTPVVIMTDKYLGESYHTVEEFNEEIEIDRGEILTEEELEKDEDFKRYKVTESGISKRSLPGQKHGTYVASSYEHDEYGFEREEEEIRVAMHNKRFRKFETMSKEIKHPELVGDENADVTLIFWGSTKGPVLEAQKILKNRGITMNYLQVLYLSPFPEEIVKNVFNTSKKCIIIEGNKTAQLNGLIRENCLIDIPNKILKYDGRGFNPQDIVDGVEKIKESEEPKTLEYATFGIIGD